MCPCRLLVLCALLVAWAGGGAAAPHAAYVIDGRTGQVLHAENAETRLHPASLTKMMTLYVAFAAVERGEIGLDDRVAVSSRAAGEGGSRLGLRAGDAISVRHLIRAVALASGNDAATALAEGVAGSEAAFVDRMNRQAAALGLRDTAFRNAHGLTAPGHLTTARDMAHLGRRLRLDFPEYWALFSRQSADAGLRPVKHTNRRFLSGYAGADGIKTGYTRAAGYTLTASARRGGKWVIASVFGAPSSAARAAEAGRLIDAAFAAIPEDAPVRWPPRPGSLRTLSALAPPFVRSVPLDASGRPSRPVAVARRETGAVARASALGHQPSRQGAPIQAPVPAPILAPAPAVPNAGGVALSALRRLR